MKKDLAMHDDKEIDNVIEKLNQKLKKDPNNDNTLFSLGITYLEKEEYSNAIKYLEKAKELNSKNLDTYFFLGAVYAIKREYEKSIRYLNKAKELNPNDSRIYLFLGMIYMKKDEDDNSIKYLEKAKELNPVKSDIYSSLGEVYYKKEKNNIAIEYLKKAVKLNSQDSASCILIAKVYFKEKNYDTSFEWLLKSEHKLIIELKNNFKKIFKKDITSKYKEILLKVYFLNNLLKIDDVDSFKRENNDYYLWQYRKFNFLEIVLENKNFWLMPTDYQNDPNEGKAFFDYIDLKNDEETTTDLVAFISCFSALKDNLIMWNSSYGEDGKGISIGIYIDKISNGKDILGSNNNNNSYLTMQEKKENNKDLESKTFLPIKEIGLYKILYVTSKKEKIKKNDKDQEAKKLLKGIKKSYKEIIKAYKNSSKEQKQNINNWLKDLFVLIRYLIKFDDYEHEKEYRLLYIDNIRKNKYVKSQTLLDGIHIETKKVLFKSEEEKDIIFIGPKSNNKFNMLKINHHLKTNDIDKYIEVKPSEIEFR